MLILFVLARLFGSGGSRRSWLAVGHRVAARKQSAERVMPHPSDMSIVASCVRPNPKGVSPEEIPDDIHAQSRSVQRGADRRWGASALVGVASLLRARRHLGRRRGPLR